MEIITDSRQMKQCDANTIGHFGVPSLVLMERAALGTAEEIDARLTEDGAQTGKKKTVLCACGLGNNGGDGIAVGRLLYQKGYDVTIVMPPERARISEETKTQMEIAKRYGIPILDSIPERDFSVTVDALFGIGLKRDVAGVYRDYLERMNGRGGLKVAVDVPSGIHSDTGEVMGTAFRADVTVTFAYTKAGLLFYPGAEYAGEVRVKDIGIDERSFLGETPALYRTEEADLARIPKRRGFTNKGSYGKVLTVAGRRNMAGAAFLSAKASYVTGAGLVKAFTSEKNRVILQQLLPEAILATYEEEPSPLLKPKKKKELEQSLLQELEWATAVVAGPGIGTGETAKALVQGVLGHTSVPVVLDADGLNVLAENLGWLKQAGAPVIVTPHLGEMARLTGLSIPEIQKNLPQVARDFAKEYNVICVLKDARTVTALPDGRAYVNASGNNGMAAAGSGDVLTGVIAGLIAQGMDVWEAAVVGVYLHGAGADRRAEAKGKYALMARDIIDGVGQVMKEQEERQRS